MRGTQRNAAELGPAPIWRQRPRSIVKHRRACAACRTTDSKRRAMHDAIVRVVADGVCTREEAERAAVEVEASFR